MSPHTAIRLLWSPKDVLKIANEGRCVGRCSSRKNCVFPISTANNWKAQKLITTIGSKPPNFASLKRSLSKIAVLLLCRKAHQNQKRKIVKRWAARVRKFASVEAEKPDQITCGSTTSTNLEIVVSSFDSLSLNIPAASIYHGYEPLYNLPSSATMVELC